MDRIHPCCLTIAGSDSGGNAGVQADLRVFHGYRLHGCTVFAALTAQNPNGVHGIHHVPADFVSAQLDAVLGTYSIASLKTGMLSDPSVIEAVAGRLRHHSEIDKVIDPVMVATSGARLTDDAAVDMLKKKLLPLARIITPNIPETEILADVRISGMNDMKEAAKRLNGTYGCSVLVKGGHSDGSSGVAADLLFDGAEFTAFSLPWIVNPVSTHGTGCSLASAITAELALGADIRTAVEGAKNYVHQAITNSYFVGANCGVLGSGVRGKELMSEGQWVKGKG